ncbi:unnamed protein product [Penicillium salamii]|uniref:DUF985 domain-containing protein n=1 Tax=Penicillium salamii TaxID=1612424 RepID=A0A9W4I817_9EURO|nr:unnamed protein product [Penicillium salamii]
MALGPDIRKDKRPQIVIQQMEWQHAQSLGDWTLVGRSVSPGFDFEGFEMAIDGMGKDVFNHH